MLDRMIDVELVAGLRGVSANRRAIVTLVDIDELTYPEARRRPGHLAWHGHEPAAPTRKRPRAGPGHRRYQLAMHN